MVVGVHPKRRSPEPPIVTLKIERSRERVRLSGDLRSEDLDQVKTEIERCGTSAVLDVEEVALEATWYVVSSNDRMIAPEQEKSMAKQMNATTTVLASSHVAMLSHPKEDAKVIEDAALGKK